MIGILKERNENVAIISLIILFTIFAILIGEMWFNNIPNMLRDISWLGILAIGQALIIINGEFDLSVGSVFAFIGMIFLLLINNSFGLLPSFALAIMLAIGIGFFSGFLTWFFGLPSLLVTLAFLFIYRGLLHFSTGGNSIAITEEIRNSWLIQLLGGETLDYHNSILIFFLILFLLILVMRSSKLGNHIYAVGGNVEAAKACGILVGRTKIFTFIICSILAGLAGIIAASNLGSVSPSTAMNIEFEAIAACVIGGCSLRGGIGTVWGAAIGVGIIIVLKSGMVMLGINIFVYQILLGILLVSVIALRVILPAFERFEWVKNTMKNSKDNGINET